MAKALKFVHSDFSYAQMNAIEHILTNGITNFTTLSEHIDYKTLAAFLYNGVIVYNNDEDTFVMTPHGIQCYCATLLTKVSGTTYKRMLDMLTRYTTLFPDQ